MKVVCLERLHSLRSPYERMPYVPRTSKRYADESPWELRFPIQPGRPWSPLHAKARVRQASMVPTSSSAPDAEVEAKQVEANLLSSSPSPAPGELSPESSISARLATPSREPTVMSSAPAPAHLSIECPAPGLRVRFSEPPSPRPIPSWHVASSSSSVPNGRPAQRAASVDAPGKEPERSLPHKLNKRGTTMHCYRTNGGTLTTPPKLATAVAFDVYLHQSDGDNHVWYASKQGTWVPATFGMLHPQFPEYTLYLSNDKWARWLLKKTVSTYAGRKVGEPQSKPRAKSIVP